MRKTCKDKALKTLSIDKDCRLFSKFGKWFLSVPTKVENKKTEVENKLCALDPGVKTFQTLYSQTACYKYQQDNDRIRSRLSKKDKYQSLKDENQIKRGRYTRLVKRVGRKSKNCVEATSC